MDLYEKLQKNAANGRYPMCMPGHKRNPKWQMENPYVMDITEIEGFDNLHDPKEILLELQNRAAAVYGSNSALLLVNGSTSGILIAISALTMPRDTILIGRNSHKSVYNVAFLRQLKIEYLYENIDKNTNLPEAIQVDEVKRGLKEHPEAVLVVITSPTYEGTLSNVKEIAKAVHREGKFLLIDSAHGAHLGFHSYFPEHAISQGADVVVQSLHKTLPSFTQTALLHWNSSFRERIACFSSIYQSSSPSYVLLASMDRCIRFLENNPKKEFDDYARQLELFYQRARAWHCLKLVTSNPEDTPKRDPSKLVILCSQTKLIPSRLPISIRNTLAPSLSEVKEVSLNGSLLYQLLLAYQIQPEMAMKDYVLCMTSVCDTKEAFGRLYEVFSEIDGCCQREEFFKPQNRILQRPKRKYHLYEIEGKEVQTVRLEESSGYTTAEFIYLYPPGIPYIVPGEILEQEQIKVLLSYQASGFLLKGLQDTNGKFVRVLAENSHERNEERT